MRNFQNKIVKTLIVRIVSIMIVFCYIGGPIHHHIGSVFHEVSGLFMMPSSVMSHEKIQTEAAFHSSYEHINFQTNDQSQFVDLFNLIFDAANNSNVPNDDSLLKHLKIDKHLISDKYTFQINHLTNYHSSPILQLVKKVDLGHLQVLDEPPKISHLGES